MKKWPKTKNKRSFFRVYFMFCCCIVIQMVTWAMIRMMVKSSEEQRGRWAMGVNHEKEKRTQVKTEYVFSFFFFLFFSFFIDIIVTSHIIGARARGYNTDTLYVYGMWYYSLRLVFIRHLCHKYEMVANKDEFSKSVQSFGIE